MLLPGPPDCFRSRAYLIIAHHVHHAAEIDAPDQRRVAVARLTRSQFLRLQCAYRGRGMPANVALSY